MSDKNHERDNHPLGTYYCLVLICTEQQVHPPTHASIVFSLTVIIFFQDLSFFEMSLKLLDPSLNPKQLRTLLRRDCAGSRFMKEDMKLILF